LLPTARSVVGHDLGPLALHFSREREGRLKLEQQGCVRLVQPLHHEVATCRALACLSTRMQVAEEGLKSQQNVAALHSAQNGLSALSPKV
jgi:hypothetical protein